MPDFSDMTVAQIAAHCGLSEPTVYRYRAAGAASVADVLRMRDEGIQRMQKAQKRIGRKAKKIEFGREK